jgi:hypothetical protein
MLEDLEEHLSKIEEEFKDPAAFKSLSFSRNSLNDDGMCDFLKVLTHSRIRVQTLNFSKNQLGKRSLIELRRFLDFGPEDQAFERLDLAENQQSLLKSASILELRRRDGPYK